MVTKEERTIHYLKLERLLNEKGITAYRLAKETGISNSVFSEWKNGRCMPKADKMVILSKYFNVPADYFLT